MPLIQTNFTEMATEVVSTARLLVDCTHLLANSGVISMDDFIKLLNNLYCKRSNFK